MRLLVLFLCSVLVPGSALLAQGRPVPLSLDSSILRPAGPLPAPRTGGGARSDSACDDFDRANGPLGPDWIDQVGAQEVFDNAGRGAAGNFNAWTMHSSFVCPYDQTTIAFDLLPSTGFGMGYVAGIHGAGGSDMLFTKLHKFSGTAYDYVGFYRGLNGGGVGGYGLLMNIPPVVEGRVTLYVSNAGDTMNVDIDEDYDGIVDYHYDHTGIVSSGLAAQLGTGMGIGAYAQSSYDDWEANHCGPGPFTLSVADLVAGGNATVSTVNGTAGGVVGVAYSIAGAGPSTVASGGCGSVTVDLGAPVTVLGTFAADANGTLTVNPFIPAGTTGTALWMQALDVGSCTLSNGVAEVIG